MRAQDMMAPPFSIGLCGLSGEDTIININNQFIYQILFLSRQISLKFFPLGSYPANKNCDIFRETYFLTTYVLVYELVPEVLEAHGVGEGFAAGLQGEGLVHVA